MILWFVKNRGEAKFMKRQDRPKSETTKKLKAEYSGLVKGKKGEPPDSERDQLFDIGKRTLQAILRDIKELRDTLQATQGGLPGADVRSVQIAPATEADLKKVRAQAILQQLTPGEKLHLWRLLRNATPDQQSKILRGLLTVGKIVRYQKASKSKLN
jgi:hypothetical protein